MLVSEGEQQLFILFTMFVRICIAPQSIRAQSPSGASGRAEGPGHLPVCLSTLCRTRGATAVPGQCCLSHSQAQQREFPESHTE